MFEPCYEHCYLRYGVQYTEECDTNCNYAKVIKESNKKDEIIEFLLGVFEQEHLGLRGLIALEVKNKFGIEY
jgi:hypothetical protein